MMKKRWGVLVLMAFSQILNIHLSAQIRDSLDLVWQDEFDGTALDVSKWQPCPEWKRQGLSYWEADNHRLTGAGELILEVTEEGDSVKCGAIRTRSLYAQKYGYFEVRCKVPQIHGGWAAFWLMPHQNLPGNQGRDGTEMDVFESINGIHGKVNHALHWDGYGDDHQSTGKSLTRPDIYDDAYHTFGLWWTPTEYVFYIDDAETWRTSAGGVSQVEQYLKLTLEVTDADWAGDWNDQVEKPIEWYIDYVRTYQPKPGTLVSDITLQGGAITQNNGILAVEATILPGDAENKELSWSVVNGSGKASVDENGLVRGIMDGEVTIVARALDGSDVKDSATVTIENQIVTRGEINLIRNGYFDHVEGNNTPSEWISPAHTAVVDGACVIDPEEKSNIWEFRFQQGGGWGLNSADLYAFSFVLTADESSTFNVDFEDAREEVDYRRLGESTHAYASNGTSDWTFDSPTSRSRYLFDVRFTHLVEESNEQLMFMLGHHDPVVAIDSVELINVKDLEKLTADYVPVEHIIVNGESSVILGESIQLAAAVEPGNATLAEVDWMLTPESGSASIDGQGMLTGLEVGTVSVQARARDDSKVVGVLKVSVTSPVGFDQQPANGLEIFPNPASHEIHVVLTHAANKVSIYDSGGKLMDELLLKGSECAFDVSNYPQGVYVVKAGNLVAKFLK